MDYFPVILQVVGRCYPDTARKRIDSFSIEELRILYEENGSAFKNSVARILCVSDHCLKTTFSGDAKEAIIGRHILLVVLRDIVWFLNAHKIVDDEIRAVALTLYTSGIVPLGDLLFVELREYIQLF